MILLLLLTGALYTVWGGWADKWLLAGRIQGEHVFDGKF
jgi:hypothetical protein